MGKRLIDLVMVMMQVLLEDPGCEFSDVKERDGNCEAEGDMVM